MIKITKEKNIFQKVLKIIEFLFMIMILITSAIIIIQRVSNNEKSLFGYRMFKVETGSMIPKYQINDVILAKEANINDIEVGDDLVYKGKKGAVKGKIVTHQVVAKENDEEGKIVLHTKGIANKTKDPVVYEDQIIGVVQNKLYIITFIINLLMNRYTLYFVFILPITIYIFFIELHGKEKRVRKEIRQRNKKAQEKEEKLKQKEKEKSEKKANKKGSKKD